MRQRGYLGPPVFATVRHFEPQVAEGPELWAPAYLLAAEMLGSVDPAYVAWSLGLQTRDLRPYEKRMRQNHMLPGGTSRIPKAISDKWRGETGSFMLFTDALVLRGLMYRTAEGTYGFTPEGDAMREAIEAQPHVEE